MSDDQKTELEQEREKMEAEATAENLTRKGKGLRVLVGATRGRSTTNIKYEAFDESDPDSLPTKVEEFVSLTGINANGQLARFLVIGYNQFKYTEASDPIAEHVNKAWDDDRKLKFRNVIRGLVANNGMTIAEAVSMVKPGTEAMFQKSLVAA